MDSLESQDMSQSKAKKSSRFNHNSASEVDCSGTQAYRKTKEAIHKASQLGCPNRKLDYKDPCLELNERNELDLIRLLLLITQVYANSIIRPNEPVRLRSVEAKKLSLHASGGELVVGQQNLLLCLSILCVGTTLRKAVRKPCLHDLSVIQMRVESVNQ